jgi:hypothetical protein
VLGIIVALLALVGFFVEGDHLLGVMNVDLTLDVLRVLIAVALLVVGFVGSVPSGAVRAVLIVVGVMYVLMGALAFADPTLFGLLPTGLTAFDIGFHLIVGVGSIAIGAAPDRAAREATNGTRATKARVS